MADATSWQALMPLLIVALFGGYLSGAVPFGLILTQLAGLGDIRSIGSGNIGATNVLRTGNKWLAALTLLLDALKGTVPVIVAAQFDHGAALLAGFGAFCGHLFPVWLRFRGGKGVATYVGVLLGLSPAMLLLFALLWVGIAIMTRYSSLAALIATAVIPIAFWISGAAGVALLTAAMTLLSYYKHRTNIARLINGTESKIGAGS